MLNICLVCLIIIIEINRVTPKKHHKDHHHDDHHHQDYFWDDYPSYSREEYRQQPVRGSYRQQLPTRNGYRQQFQMGNGYRQQFPTGNYYTQQFPTDDEGICGLTPVVNKLIVNGQDLEEGTFPWLAAIFSVKTDGPSFICGGTLITLKHIVTAAHCVRYSNKQTANPKDLLVVLGKCDLSGMGAADMLKVASIQPHNDYKFLSADGDIAVIELQNDLVLNKSIKPACLWSGDDSIEAVVGEVGVVAGWGKTEKGVLSLSQPKFAKMPIVSQEQCLRSHPQFAAVTSSRTLCAGNNDGSGPCNGDSGGGLMIRRNGQWALRGLVSLSLASGVPVLGCDLSLYVVFTDVSKYSDWLYSVIK
ncbi:unnamed protein product [Phyllotreta striolata]|uniref:Peptidase S1 domain-containing protein n=1 Tax=Phyllotreta striolata TaxID=444603 RepID=A0A9N9TML0_PHYSR|nr:unnamed protein product [Phyllotreta striolata]